MNIYLWMLPFALLPIRPEFFALLALLGVYFLKPYGRLIGSALILIAVFGVSILGVNYPRVTPSICSDQANTSVNIFPRQGLNDLRGWRSDNTPGSFAQPLSDGFWRTLHKDARSGLQHSEIVSFVFYKLEPNKPYTISLIYRHNGTEANLSFIRATEKSYGLTKTQVTKLDNEFTKLSATFTVDKTDTRVRALDISVQGGDWTYIDIGCVQLEQSSTPSAYSPGPDNYSRYSATVWWVGIFLLGFLVFEGSRYLLTQAGSLAAPALLVGLIIHIGLAFLLPNDVGTHRPLGLTPQPNFLGASILMNSALLLLFPTRWQIFGLGLALFGIAITGSRTAFLGWILMSFTYMSVYIRHYWPIAIALVLSFAGIFILGANPILGRLSTVFDSAESTTQARLQIWHVAWEGIKQYGWHGIGIGQFGQYYVEHRPPNALEPFAHAHNLFLQLWIETGIAGMLTFLGFWFYVAWWFIQRKAWAAVGLIGLAFFINLTDYTFFSAWVYYPLWVGLAWISLRVEPLEGVKGSLPANESQLGEK